MNKLKTGDEVIIISGKDKGKTGTLTKFLAKDKCIVMGVKNSKKTSETQSSVKYCRRNNRKRIPDSHF